MGVNMHLHDDAQLQAELQELKAQEQAIAISMQVELGDSDQQQASRLMEDQTNLALQQAVSQQQRREQHVEEARRVQAEPPSPVHAARFATPFAKKVWESMENKMNRLEKAQTFSEDALREMLS